MRKKDVQRFKSICWYEKEYGYMALSDYHDYYKFKCLDKIHKLKRKNKQLSDQRKSIMNQMVFIKETCDLGGTSKIITLTISLARLSEHIGRNSNKIQRMRSSYKQMAAKANRMINGANKEK